MASEKAEKDQKAEKVAPKPKKSALEEDDLFEDFPADKGK